MELLTNIIAVLAIVLILGGAVLYIVLAKKRGEKCIGCPHAKLCGGNCQGSRNNSKKKDPDDRE